MVLDLKLAVGLHLESSWDFFSEFAIHIKMNQNVRKLRVFDSVAVRVQDEVVSRENLPRMYPDQLLSRSCHRLLGSFASPNFIAVTKQ